MARTTALVSIAFTAATVAGSSTITSPRNPPSISLLACRIWWSARPAAAKNPASWSAADGRGGAGADDAPEAPGAGATLVDPSGAAPATDADVPAVPEVVADALVGFAWVLHAVSPRPRAVRGRQGRGRGGGARRGWWGGGAGGGGR